MKRICLDCSEPIQGRADKKFCDDQCRSNYNNRLKTDQSNFEREVNTILRKNKSILRQANPEGKTKTNKDKLLSKGFNFNYFTHVYQTQKGHQYHFCYEYGYLRLDNEEILLVKRDESQP